MTEEVSSLPKAAPPVKVTRVPLSIVALHAMARRGHASRYAPGSKRFASFDIDAVMRSKWPDLDDSDLVILIYRDLNRRVL